MYIAGLAGMTSYTLCRAMSLEYLHNGVKSDRKVLQRILRPKSLEKELLVSVTQQAILTKLKLSNYFGEKTSCMKFVHAPRGLAP